MSIEAPVRPQHVAATDLPPVAGVDTPDRTLAQRLVALDRVNTVRTYRARLKRDVQAGQVDVARLFTDPPELVCSMKVEVLLRAVPTLGRVKVARVLSRCGVSPSKSLGGLSDRQRASLTAELEGRRR